MASHGDRPQEVSASWSATLRQLAERAAERPSPTWPLYSTELDLIADELDRLGGLCSRYEAALRQVNVLSGPTSAQRARGIAGLALAIPPRTRRAAHTGQTATRVPPIDLEADSRGW